MTDIPADSKAEGTITYAVHYRTVDSKDDDWFVMTGRNHNERYRHAVANSSGWETSSMLEAIDTAEALFNQLAFPGDPTAYHHRRVTDSRVVTMVSVGQVTAVYTTPKED